MRPALTRLAALLALLPAALAAGRPPLSEYSCVRPEPWEAGAVKNVSIAAALIHGTVLAPGEEFSFNQAMEPGLDRFVEGTSYASGRVVTSDGGGICQVSSGLYNAVVLAGLVVLERRTHSLYDPRGAYVPPGRDAMVTRVGKADFRFRNSTASALTIQAKAVGGRLDISLKGRQRRPRERWIETEVLEQRPFETLEVVDPKLAPGQRKLSRRGFDGLVVKRRVCWKNSKGETGCTPLSVDRYMKVDERWKVGPPAEAPAAGGEAASTVDTSAEGQP